MPGAAMYRVPASVVKLGAGFSVIQDNGVLRRTTTDSNGSFLFSPVGAGVKAMALIGTLPEIKEWSINYSNCKISNKLSDLSAIYMGMCPYIPGRRYKGLFPANDMATAIMTKGVAIGGSHAPSMGGLGDVGEDVQALAEELVDKSESLFKRIFAVSKKPKSDLTLYVKLHYLPEDKMKMIGEGEILIQRLYEIIESTAEAMFKK